LDDVFLDDEGGNVAEIDRSRFDEAGIVARKILKIFYPANGVGRRRDHGEANAGAVAGKALDIGGAPVAQIEDLIAADFDLFAVQDEDSAHRVLQSLPGIGDLVVPHHHAGDVRQADRAVAHKNALFLGQGGDRPIRTSGDFIFNDEEAMDGDDLLLVANVEKSHWSDAAKAHVADAVVFNMEVFYPALDHDPGLVSVAVVNVGAREKKGLLAAFARGLVGRKYTDHAADGISLQINPGQASQRDTVAAAALNFTPQAVDVGRNSPDLDSARAGRLHGLGAGRRQVGDYIYRRDGQIFRAGKLVLDLERFIHLDEAVEGNNHVGADGGGFGRREVALHDTRQYRG